jgi:hypothetical protein
LLRHDWPYAHGLTTKPTSVRCEQYTALVQLASSDDITKTGCRRDSTAGVQPMVSMGGARVPLLSLVPAWAEALTARLEGSGHGVPAGAGGGGGGGSGAAGGGGLGAPARARSAHRLARVLEPKQGAN